MVESQERAREAMVSRRDEARFLADAMLGRLATWLRILGFDAEYDRAEDAVLLARAAREGRIFLTRDTGILRRRRALPPHLFIRSDAVQEQLREVLLALRLAPRHDGRRCPRCNVALTARTREEVGGRVPDFVCASHETFWACARCGRIYWPGTHRRRMEETIRALSGDGC